MTTIRSERPGDIQAIRDVNQSAFETPAEASLVDLLRDREKLVVSLVAEYDGRVVGHIAFSRASISSQPALRGFGLGPMAVIPSFQNRGIGSQLVHAGLHECKKQGAQFAVVLGHLHY